MKKDRKIVFCIDTPTINIADHILMLCKMLESAGNHAGIERASKQSA